MPDATNEHANGSDPGNEALSSGAVVLLAAAVGMAGGLLEVGAQSTRRAMGQQILFLSRDSIWTVPLALGLLGVCAAVLSLLVARRVQRLDAVHGALFGAGIVALWSPLMLVPGVHHAASLLLAAGLAMQLGRIGSRHQRRMLSLVRPTTLILSAAVLVLAFVARTGSTSPATGVADESPSERRPNVLFIVMDTVRAENLSLYGHSRLTTPVLDRLAGEAIVFDRAMSTAPWTLPSHAGMFTGEAPHALSTNWLSPLDETHSTLAERLVGQGYRAGGVVANLGYCSYETGLDRGFDHWEDYTLSVGQVAADTTLLKTVADNFRLRGLLRNDEHLNRKTAAEVNEAALAWIDTGEQPFFLFLNYFDAHEPYLPPAPFDSRFGQRRHAQASPLHHYNWNPAVWELTPEQVQEEMDAYDSAIAYVDFMIGELLGELGDRGLLEDTLVVVTSDHGEEFGEHGLFDHGNSLYVQSLHVPLLIRYPGVLPEGIRVDGAVSLADLPATIIDAVGEAGSAPFAAQGLSAPFAAQSLRRHWESLADVEAVALSEVSQGIGTAPELPVSRGDMSSLVNDGYHYILNGDGVEELYDLSTDPEALRDLSGEASAAPILQRFRLLLDSALEPGVATTGEPLR